MIQKRKAAHDKPALNEIYVKNKQLTRKQIAQIQQLIKQMIKRKKMK
ncbi:hypothetical protein IMG5_183440 [Ichthyophthirius multifiliis]|uniref:Uncharacterized protein n=1 Tax=Ichthyophthirius multifiliis TaxID=5932 RepID=G0R364_ICHMU|nr:hypothetical protein IMG5_183440 [Ichthyophthirius multifiliis]EGR28087.1 hypothetical protein IMG5_183440 [Ichthyophthirius multifiliis]|eukprot:XP_004027432.1 hypothetical protein IMG5_183440 [Ichthyophthirius multifiliis]